jgi:hypothetical protein
MLHEHLKLESQITLVNVLLPNYAHLVPTKSMQNMVKAITILREMTKDIIAKRRQMKVQQDACLLDMLIKNEHGTLDTTEVCKCFYI